MKLVFNPTGTHIKQDMIGDKFLKVRLDFYPEPTEKTYELHHVYMPVYPESGYPGKVDELGSPVDIDNYNSWEASLPHIWQLNPCMCNFFTIQEGADTDDFLSKLSRRLSPDDIATLDNYLILEDSSHYVNPFINSRLKFTSSKVQTSDLESLIADVNTKFSGINELKSKGISGEISPQSIDVGAAAINRGTAFSLYTYTMVEESNPANATGTISSVEVWVSSSTPACNTSFGTVTMSGNNATSNDWEAVGRVTAGSKQTFNGLDIDVTSGDYIGASDNGGTTNLETDSSGGTGMWYYSGTKIDGLSSTAMTHASGYQLSLYGTGTESGGGWGGEFCGVAVAEFDGVTPDEIDGV